MLGFLTDATRIGFSQNAVLRCMHGSGACCPAQLWVPKCHKELLLI